MDEAAESPLDTPLSLTHLPIELIAAIALHLRPTAHPSVFPHPKAQSLDVSTLTLTSGKVTADLLAFAYTCRKVYLATLPALYFAIPLTSTRRVRLIAQSLTQAYQPKSPYLDNYNKSRQPRHLFMPNDGLLLGNDQLADQSQWAPSLRTLFRKACHRLDSALLGCRGDGAILSEFLDSEVKAQPRRVTILNFYASPPFSLYHLRPLGQVTHLHLINLIPRDPLIKLLSGRDPNARSDQRSHPIQVIRISQLQSETLLDFAEYIRWRRAFEEWDSQSPSTRRLTSASGSTGPPNRPRGPARKFEAQETLYSLAEASCRMPSLKRLVLELGELPRLSEPEDTPLLGNEIASDAATDAEGGLVTTNHAFDAPVHATDGLGDDQDTADLVNDAGRARTAERDAYWIETRVGKEALQTLFDECRSTQDGISEKGSSLRNEQTQPLPRVEVRIVAAKPGGWDQNECRQDFDAQVQACIATPRRLGDEALHEVSTPQTSPPVGLDDGTCFSDPDVFWLAAHRPWLSYDGARRSDFDPLEGGDWRKPNAQGAWWTGSLPRFDAGRTS